jgi:hypothetical protein
MQTKTSEKIDTTEVLKDPHSFGLPTFEEYCKNTDRYEVTSDLNNLEMLSGSLNGADRKKVVRHQYAVDGIFMRHYNDRGLYEAFTEIKNLGLSLDLCKIVVGLDDNSGTLTVSIETPQGIDRHLVNKFGRAFTDKKAQKRAHELSLEERLKL